MQGSKTRAAKLHLGRTTTSKHVLIIVIPTRTPAPARLCPALRMRFGRRARAGVRVLVGVKEHLLVVVVRVGRVGAGFGSETVTGPGGLFHAVGERFLGCVAADKVGEGRDTSVFAVAVGVRVGPGRRGRAEGDAVEVLDLFVDPNPVVGSEVRTTSHCKVRQPQVEVV